MLWPSGSRTCSLSLHSQALKVLWTKQINQTDSFFPTLQASRFLGARPTTPFLASTADARHPASPVWGCPRHGTGKRNRTRGTAYEIEQLRLAPKGRLGWELLPDSETCDPHGQGCLHRPLLPPRIKWLIFPSSFLSLSDDCSIDTRSHVLRSDPICRGSGWLETTG